MYWTSRQRKSVLPVQLCQWRIYHIVSIMFEQSSCYQTEMRGFTKLVTVLIFCDSTCTDKNSLTLTAVFPAFGKKANKTEPEGNLVS